MKTSEDLIEMINSSINHAWFGNPEDGPWPNDPDGGELRIANALIYILSACDHADGQGKPQLQTSYIRTVVKNIFTKGMEDE